MSGFRGKKENKKFEKLMKKWPSLNTIIFQSKYRILTSNYSECERVAIFDIDLIAILCLFHYTFPFLNIESRVILSNHNT